MFPSHRLTLPVVFTLVIMSPLAIDIYLPSLPEMTHVFGGNQAAMQLTISLFMICMGVGQLFAGPISDRYGRRASALLGTGLYVIGSMLATFADSLTALYVARILQGIGAAFCSVTAFAWVRDHFDARESGKFISYMGGMIGTMTTLAPTLGGVLIVYGGWTASFLFMAALGFSVLVGSLLCLEKGRPAHSASEEKGHIGEYAKEILSNPQFLLYSLTGMLTMGGILAYATNAPFVAMNLAGLDEFGFAMAFGGLGMTQMLANLAAPSIANRIGRRKTIVVGGCLALVGAIGMLFVPMSDPLLYFIPAAIGVIGFNIVFGTASGLTLEHFKHCAGMAAAIDGCVRMAGGGLVASAIKLAGWNVFDTVALGYGLILIPLTLIVRDIGVRASSRPDVKPHDRGLSKAA